jgi:hypothetical protein
MDYAMGNYHFSIRFKSMSDMEKKGKTSSIYQRNPQAWKELREKLKLQGKKLGDELNDWVENRLAELQGGAQPNGSPNSGAREQEYEKLRIQQLKLKDQTAKLELFLRTKKLFDLFYFVAVKKVGLDWGDLHNLNECLPRLFQAWKEQGGQESDLHVCITYVELSEKRVLVERRLREMRLERSNPFLKKGVVEVPSPDLAVIPPR